MWEIGLSLLGMCRSAHSKVSYQVSINNRRAVSCSSRCLSAVWLQEITVGSFFPILNERWECDREYSIGSTQNKKTQTQHVVYHSVPKHKNNLYWILMDNCSLYFGTGWYLVRTFFSIRSGFRKTRERACLTPSYNSCRSQNHGRQFPVRTFISWWVPGEVGTTLVPG